MNRAILPTAGVVTVALAVLGAAVLPVQQPQALPGADDDRARVTVVCPVVAGGGTGSSIAVGSPQAGLTSADLATPDRPEAVAGPLAVAGDVTEPLVIAAPRQDVFSATTRTAVESGSDRGLSLMSCGRPTASAWFAGVVSSGAGTAEVVLVNADTTDAVVDLTVYGAEGRLTAPGSRGIAVPARSRRVVPLGPLFTAEQPVALHAVSSVGRVVAAVRQRRLTGDTAAGSDWLAPTADPATAVVLPGLPAGPGGRNLVVTNPGERTASVTLQVLGAAGPTAVPGFETLDLPPGTTRTVPLEAPLAEAPAGVRLTSEQKVTAAVLSGNGGTTRTADVSMQVATAVLTGPGVVALAPGTRTLHLATGTAEPVPVRVVASSADATVLDTTVVVPGLADSTVRLPAGDNLLVAIEPGRPGAVHASVAVRVRIGDVTGVASAAVLPGAAAATLPPVRPDPRVGS